MRITVLIVAACFVVIAVRPIVGQSGSSKPATYITKEEIDIVNKQPGGDRQIKVVDIGHENFAVGIVHRGATGAPAAGGGGGAARANTPAPEPCGEKSATPLPAGAPSGLTHDSQTEGYYIVSGGGTMVTGGKLTNAKEISPGQTRADGIQGGQEHHLSKGDVLTIPANTPHWWKDTSKTGSVGYYAVNIEQ